MNWFAKGQFYARALFLKRKLEAQLTEEVRTHVEMATEANVARGMSPDEARYAALREFGNVASIQEQAREGRGWVWLEQWGKDAAFAIRSLSRARGFTLAVWGTLVVGIGVATVVFDLTSQIIFSQPYPQAEQLFLIGFKDKQNVFMPYRTGLHFQAYQEQVNAFSEYAAVRPDITNVVVQGEPVIANVLSASIDCFRTLGIKPVLGRCFLPEEHRAGADNVVILAGLFWRQHFNASPDVLGRKILIDQQVCTVIGVLAADQAFPPAFAGAVYRPLVLKVDPAEPFTPTLYIIGRLRPGISVEQARLEIAAVKLPAVPPWAAAYFAEQEPVLNKPTELARPETQWVTLIAAALLYTMACLNAMNLMLVRLLGRRLELSIRLALGGSRWQIVRLLVIESAGLALLSSLTVILAARWLFPPIFATITGSEALRYASYCDWRTLGCIVELSFLASVVVVLVPVWRIFRVEISPGLKDGGRAMGGSRRLGSLRTALVMLQAALAVILLAGTGLMVRSFEKLRDVDLGFDPVGKVKVLIAFPAGYNLGPEARLQLFQRLQQRLTSLPGVKGVSIGQDSLLEGGFWGTGQLQMADGTYQPSAGSFVDADFYKVAGLTIMRGRWFSDKRGTIEVVINETLARTRFGTENPVGQYIKLLVSGDAGYLVVGVVRDVKENVRSSAGMRAYWPDWVYPLNVSTLVLRLDKDPNPAFADLVRRAVYEFDPKLIAPYVSSINSVVDQLMWAERNAFDILKGLSAIALGLAAMGLFSVIAFTVNSRTKEFGVRLALGARPADLHRLVMKRGLATVAVGVGIGTVGALGLTRFMQSLLFETTPNDPVVYLADAVVLLVAAVLACWLPARRAAKVDPMIALRAE
jgi:putative ABC transport system permease protein